MKVGVFGATGRMGRTVCEAVHGDPDLELVAAVNARTGDVVCGLTIVAEAQSLVDAGARVAVDFTVAKAAKENIEFCVSNGIHCVVGTTGLSADELAEVEKLCSAGRANVFVAPNFSIGAILMMHLSKQVARYLGSCEVIEEHHNQKLDAPSGTAIATARGIAETWERYGRPPGGAAHPDEEEKLSGARGASLGGVGLHSVRLLGLEAHQEVVFGGLGQTLTIRHDAMNRTSYMPGVLLAVKSVGSRPGLTVGLENLLDL